MMNHRGYAQQSAPAGHFIGTGEVIGTGPLNVTLPAGCLAGDLAVALSASTTNADQLTTLILTSSGPGFAFRVSRQTVSSGDISNGYISTVGTGTGTTLVGFYRGPTTATNPALGFNDNTTSPPVTCSGFTKNAGAQVIAYFIGAPSNPTFSGNPGTLRATSSDGRVALADFDPASLYTNGTPESWNYISLANVLMPALDLH